MLAIISIFIVIYTRCNKLSRSALISNKWMQKCRSERKWWGEKNWINLNSFGRIFGTSKFFLSLSLSYSFVLFKWFASLSIRIFISVIQRDAIKWQSQWPKSNAFAQLTIRRMFAHRTRNLCKILPLKMPLNYSLRPNLDFHK